MRLLSSLARLTLATGLLLLVACDEKGPPLRQQGLQPGEEVPKGPIAAPAPAPPPPPPPRSSALPSPFAKANDPGALAKPGAAGDKAGEPTTAEDKAAAPAAPPAKPARDLPTELASVLGQPLNCLDLEAVVKSGGRITVGVTAQVVPSGRITRATATAPGQPASALRCIEQHATSSAMTGPIEGAPTQVTATFPIEIVATKQ